jgi:3-oxoacyl-[acyl-carrier protein] reductase
MELHNKTIAITGGGRGLGAAMARRLAKQGCNIALVDLDQQALDETAAECKAVGAPDVATFNVNVASEPDVVQLFIDIGSHFKALHGLINNAGITRDGLTVKFKDGELISKMTLQNWQQVMDVNLTGVFLCGREAATNMIQLGCEGCIINISSISRQGNMGQINYSAAKAGVEAMSVVWAKEFARYGLRSASIAPGFIGTEMVMAMKPEARTKLTSQIPAGRVGQPEEIAATVQFILENDYVSGRCFEIDGAMRL